MQDKSCALKSAQIVILQVCSATHSKEMWKGVHSLLEGGEDVRVTWVLDAHHAHSVESARSSSELNIVSFEVEHSGSSEDSHVLELGLSDGRAVV